MNNHIMQGLWVGKKLSEMEQLSICSFLANGHEFHLYTYGICEGVPKGCIVKDANEIIPESEIKQYVSLANFSDAFRYRLLQSKENWWVDVDTVCLRPFDFTDDYVFSCEILATGKTLVDASPLKIPQDSEFLKEAVRRVAGIDTLHPNGGGALGPDMVDALTLELGLRQYVRPSYVFNPILCYETSRFISTAPNVDLRKSYAAHLWHSQWPFLKGDRPAGCLYETLKRKYTPNAASYVIPHAKQGYCRKHKVLGCGPCSLDQGVRY